MEFLEENWLNLYDVVLEDTASYFNILINIIICYLVHYVMLVSGYIYFVDFMLQFYKNDNKVDLN